jgi:hypothetical protein
MGTSRGERATIIRSEGTKGPSNGFGGRRMATEMRSIDNYRKILITAVVMMFSAPLAASQRVSLGAIEFRVSSEWSESSDSASRVASGSFVATWSEPRRDGSNGSPGAVVDVQLLGTRPIVSSASVPAIRASIEKDLRAIDEVIDFEVRSVEVTNVDGVPAYRIRSTLRTEEREVEQLQLLLVSGSAYLLTFTAEAEDFEEFEPRFESLVESIRVREKPSLSAALPIFGVGLFAGVFRLGRRVRSRLPR